MDRGLTDAARALGAARYHIARALHGDEVADARLGGLVLRPHQITAVSRLLKILATFRGALLGDAVGLGKTYVALAVAREHGNAMIICPAGLRSMWLRAMEAARVDYPITSVEALSRGATPECGADLLIVDEAHHLRTSGTRRYEAVARLARRSRVLLLSATPLQNSRRDLTAVLALFAGTAVREWSDAALARLMVRRDDSTAHERLPTLDGPHGLAPACDDDCVEAILALPPTVPAADEGVAHALTIVSLVHLWTSSRAALVASVRKRIARAAALRDAVASGHMPTSLELSAWRFADGALQLAFPLFTSVDESVDPDALIARLDAFTERAQALVDHCRRTSDPDDERVRLLRSLCQRHRGARIVAFSQYANTVAAIGRLMRGDAGIAIVTADAARIASGAITREEVLAQFGLNARQSGPIDRIDLLLTTDLLSEGIDLRGASVIVHLDLPWNPARLEQRVGRSRRIGSPFETIHVYTFLPPTAADRLIELRRRLSEKVRTARSVVGGGFDPLGENTISESPVSAGELLRSRLLPWLDRPVQFAGDTTPFAAATAPASGWLAAVRVDGVARLISDVGKGIHEDPARILETIDCLGPACVVDAARAREAAARVIEWMAAREAATGLERQSRAKRAVLDRLSHVVDRMPRHRRQAALDSAQRTRAALTDVTGAAVEQQLTGFARSADEDDTWLRSVEAFAALHGDTNQIQGRDSALIALILLEPLTAEGGATPG